MTALYFLTLLIYVPWSRLNAVAVARIKTPVAPEAV